MWKWFKKKVGVAWKKIVKDDKPAPASKTGLNYNK